MKKHDHSVLLMFWFLLRGKLPGNIFLVSVGLIAWVLTHSPITLMVIVTVLFLILLSRALKNGRSTAAKVAKDIHTWNKAQLRDVLLCTQADLKTAQARISYLEADIQLKRDLTGTEELRDDALRLIAATLTAYDTSKGRISTQDVVESLRANLSTLGKEFQEDATRHFDDASWENAYSAMGGFASRRM